MQQVFSFFLHTREKPAILAIGCISTVVITLMYFSWDFSFEGYMHIGIAWSMTITAFVVILTLVSLIMKIKDILVK